MLGLDSDSFGEFLFLRRNRGDPKGEVGDSLFLGTVNTGTLLVSGELTGDTDILPGLLMVAKCVFENGLTSESIDSRSGCEALSWRMVAKKTKEREIHVNKWIRGGCKNIMCQKNIYIYKIIYTKNIHTRLSANNG